jgi:hypothetical protein
MAIIPAEEKVFMVSNSTNTTYSGSAALKAMQQWYTMEDVTNTVRPYQVFTALLTQSGESDMRGKDSGTLILGVTYVFANPSIGIDFSNVGAPNNNVGTYFIATGTTPNSWGEAEGLGDNLVVYDLGAPVATVLENTLGNVWFTYYDVGNYLAHYTNEFNTEKTTYLFQYTNPNSNIFSNFDDIGILPLRLSSYAGGIAVDGYISQIPIEIRVYN